MKFKRAAIALLILLATLATLGGGAAYADEAEDVHVYRITVHNLAPGQPLTPPIATAHSRDVRVFQRNALASPELEAIAEDGDSGPLAALLGGLDEVTDVASAGAPLTPRGTVVGDFNDTVVFEITGTPGDRLSLASMLVCSNDGFAGLDRVALPVWGMRYYWAKGYDAGTEDNTELSGDIVDPCSLLGPLPLPNDPDGNEDAAVDTDPQDKIRRHSGIMGGGDLSATDHGWRGAVALIKVERLRNYRITVHNVTDGQPLTPPLAVTHKHGVNLFQRNGLASPELEFVAEDGDSGPLAALLGGLARVTEVASATAPLTPRGTTVGDFTDTVSFEITAAPGDRLSLVSMLVCTNDGFAGLDRVRLPLWGKRTYWVTGYDAGTEDNTELSGDIVDPCSLLGPVPLAGDPNGNEDAAVDSDPQHKIRRHSGIVGGGDLSATDHDWRGAVATVKVEVID